MEKQPHPEAEGEEAEVVEEAEVLIMEGATDKEVNAHFCGGIQMIWSGKNVLDINWFIDRWCHIKFCVLLQVASEHTVTGTTLTLDTVSVHFIAFNPGLMGHVFFCGLQLGFHY